MPNFILIPIGSLISRKNEFAADHFAVQHIESPLDLSNAKGDSSRVNRKVEWVIPEIESTRILNKKLLILIISNKNF